MIAGLATPAGAKPKRILIISRDADAVLTHDQSGLVGEIAGGGGWLPVLSRMARA